MSGLFHQKATTLPSVWAFQVTAPGILGGQGGTLVHKSVTIQHRIPESSGLLQEGEGPKRQWEGWVGQGRVHRGTRRDKSASAGLQVPAPGVQASPGKQEGAGRGAWGPWLECSQRKCSRNGASVPMRLWLPASDRTAGTPALAQPGARGRKEEGGAAGRSWSAGGQAAARASLGRTIRHAARSHQQVPLSTLHATKETKKKPSLEPPPVTLNSSACSVFSLHSYSRLDMMECSECSSQSQQPVRRPWGHHVSVKTREQQPPWPER